MSSAAKASTALWLFAWGVFALLSATSPSAGATNAPVVDPVARVNGEPITRAEWQRSVVDPRTRALYQREQGIVQPNQQTDPRAFGQWVVKKLVVKHLTLQEAARRKITVSDDELDRAVQAWKTGYKGGPKAAQKSMQKRGMSEDVLREVLRNDMLIARVTSEIIKDVKLSDKEARAYYAKHKSDYQVPEEVLLKVIAVKDKATADGLIASLRNGESFDAVARQVSTTPDSAKMSEGRWVPVSAMPPVLREPVAALKAGETTNALQGRAEYYVVRLEDRRAGRLQTFEEVRPQIDKRLLPDKQKEALQTWLRKQEKKAKVEILLT